MAHKDRKIQRIPSKTVLEHLLLLVFSVLYCSSIFFAFISSTTIVTPWPILLGVCIAIVVTVYFIFVNRIVRWTCIGIVGGGIVFGLGFALVAYGFKGIRGLAAAWYHWFKELLLSNIELPAEYGIWVAGVTCVFFAIFTVVFLVKHYSFYALAGFGFTFFVLQLIGGYFDNVWAFILLLFTLCTLAASQYFCRRKNRPVTANTKSGIALFCIPLCAVIVLVAAVLPYWEVPRQTLDWGMFDNAYTQMFDQWFSFASTGFGNSSSKLGGDVHLNNSRVMEVKADQRTYLRGIIKDVYTGEAWQVSDLQMERQETAGMFETKETTANILRQNGYFYDYEQYSTAQIEYINMRTRSVFQPLKPLEINMTWNYPIWRDSNGAFYTHRTLGNGYQYSYDYLTANQAKLPDLLRKCYPGYYSSQYESNGLSVLPASVRDQDNDQIAVDQLIAYAESVYETYTQLPDTLPTRVVNKAFELTQDCDNDYDRCKAIEDYLKEQSYTLTPPPVPEGADFVDWFLFEAPTGYCTYYASAMAVMLRSLGIPARYVEGYAMPMTSSNRTYTITNQQAHAWVEVYFEGYGWVQFEPTAPYNYMFYGIVPPIEQIFSTDMLENPEYTSYIESFLPAEIRRVQRQGGGFNGAYTVLSDTNSIPTASDPESSSMPSSSQASSRAVNPDNHAFPLWIIWPLCGGALLILLAVVLAHAHTCSQREDKARREGLPLEYKIMDEYEQIIRLAAFDGHPLYKPDTPVQFGRRLDQTYPALGVSFEQVSLIFEQTRYSPHKATQSELSLVEDARDRLEKHVKEKRGKRRFWVHRHLLHKI